MSSIETTNVIDGTETNGEVKEEKELYITTKNTDSVVFSVIEGFKQRADIGFKKYGVNLDRQDLSLQDWIQHAQEEHMDAILYLEKIKQIEKNSKK
jgi:hypothetical protein